MKSFSRLGTFVLFKKIDLMLKKNNFQSVMENIVNDAEKITIKNYTEDEMRKIEKKINKSLHRIEVASTIYWHDAKCLHRTIAQYILFRKRCCLPVKMIIGVKKFPFSSHMWLEWQGKQERLVCEYEENIVGYDIIFDSDKNIERL